MTEDSAPPWPIFEARLLRTNCDSNTCRTTRFIEKAVDEISFDDTLYGNDSLLFVWRNRALKIGPGCVLSCVTPAVHARRCRCVIVVLH